MKWDYVTEEEGFDSAASGLFILCEGNFQYGNSSLSFYNPGDNSIENNIFFRANGMKLGDVAQSMTIHDGKGWIVVNNSHVVFAIDVNTFKEVGRIEGFTSPRYILFVNDEKAYVSQLWDNRIYIINPKKYEITGYIEVPEMAMGSGSTEQMVLSDGFVYCSSWSYQDRLIKIDTETDKVIDQLKVGTQPTSIVLDSNGYLWTMTDGGYEGSPFGYEAPRLLCIKIPEFTIEKSFSFRLGDTPRSLTIDESGKKLYWINDDVWCMDVGSDRLPVLPLIKARNTKYFGMTTDPSNGEIYVADAIDYMQNGIIYRFSESGFLIDEFYVGVTPSAFCWK